MTKKHWFFALLLPFWACSDEPEKIPSYLELKPFTVNATGGADWQKITEGWLYVNTEFLGAYTLPATVPVLAEGNANILLYPGIKENGINATPNIYDFLAPHAQTLQMTEGSQHTLQPVTSYKTDIFFPWALDRTTFDGLSSIVLENRDTDDATSFQVTADGGFSGKSVKLAVTIDHPSMDIATEKVVLPSTPDRQIWLEMHYRNDMPFTLFLLGETDGSTTVANPVFQFNNSPEWNKIYFNLTTLATQNPVSAHRLFFRVELPKNAAGQFSQTSGTVYIDNLRLVHF